MQTRRSQRFSLALVLIAVLFTGCVSSRRYDTGERIASGDFELVIASAQVALQKDPGNVDLQVRLLSARQLVTERMLARASSFRASGDLPSAISMLQRLLLIAPESVQAHSQLLELDRDQRSMQAIVSAKDFLSHGQNERATLVMESALKDDPRNAELLRFVRQLELDSSRQQELGSARLSEVRPISLDFRDANIRMVLDAVSRSSGINFIVDKDVRSDLRATIFLRQAKTEDVLDLICSTNQLGKKVLDAQTVLIYPNTVEKTREYQDLTVRAFYLASADPKQVATMLKSMLKIREPYVDDRLSLLVLRETPEMIRLAERLVALLDVSEPEVMMEVEVLEISSTRLTELGVKYPDNLTLTPLGVDGASAAATLADLSGLNRNRIGINTPTLTINLRREVGDANLLANPRIRARNREKAKILIGDKLPVITSTATSTGFVSESVQYIDVGLKLEVEPNVYLDDEVAIKIALEVSSLKGTIRTSGGSTAYQIGTRSANTVLRLKDGETQILAGLINRQEAANASRIPGLGDLPILGRLFSSQLDTKDKTEIVLSLTPHIVRNIRRPELYQAEFWSGTEANARSRPLRLPQTSSASNGPATLAAIEVQGKIAAPPTAPSATQGTSQQASVPDGSLLRLNSTREVNAGDEVLVTLELSSSKEIRGLPLQLAFDKDRLSLIEIQEGTYFKQGNEEISFSQNINAADGTAQLGAIRNGSTGVKGTGSVAVLRFKAVAAGDAKISITDTNPIAAGEPVNLTIGDPISVKVLGKS